MWPTFSVNSNLYYTEYSQILLDFKINVKVLFDKIQSCDFYLFIFLFFWQPVYLMTNQYLNILNFEIVMYPHIYVNPKFFLTRHGSQEETLFVKNKPSSGFHVRIDLTYIPILFFSSFTAVMSKFNIYLHGFLNAFRQ